MPSPEDLSLFEAVIFCIVILASVCGVAGENSPLSSCVALFLDEKSFINTVLITVLPYANNLVAPLHSDSLNLEFEFFPELHLPLYHILKICILGSRFL